MKKTTDFGGRKLYTVSSQGVGVIYSYNFSKAENLLDEQEMGFSLGANYGSKEFGVGGEVSENLSIDSDIGGVDKFRTK